MAFADRGPLAVQRVPGRHTDEALIAGEQSCPTLRSATHTGRLLRSVQRHSTTLPETAWQS
jgi:hypothetical protein